jgi:hypothetical protein
VSVRVRLYDRAQRLRKPHAVALDCA